MCNKIKQKHIMRKCSKRLHVVDGKVLKPDRALGSGIAILAHNGCTANRLPCCLPYCNFKGQFWLL